MTLGFGLIFTVTYLFQVCLFYKYRSWKWLFLRLNKDYSFIQGGRWYHSLLRVSPPIIYRLSIIGTFLSCGVTSFQSWGGLNPQWYEMMSTENFQYLLIAVLWFISGQSIYKICPFMILSYIHLTNYQMEFKGNGAPDKIASKNAIFLRVLALSEIVIAVVLLLDSLLMKDGTAGITLVVYLAIYWLRINFSPYVQVAALKVLLRFDKNIPSKYKDNWAIVKKFIYLKVEAHKKREEELVRTA